MPDISAATIEVQRGLFSPGIVTHDLTFERHRARIDPFIIVSLFDMSGPVFPPHPHAGFSVATYIFPESDIGFWNQDTLGTVNAIAPGALHLSVAGAGLMHEETVARSGRHATGFQIWIDHADADREVPPRALYLAAGDVPRMSGNGVTRRVLLGASGGVASPLAPPVSVGLVDVEMDAGAVFEEAVEPSLNAFLWVRAGAVAIDVADVPAGSAAFLPGRSVRALARERTRLTLFTGRPLRHDIVPAGPFVASDRSQAAAFRDRYASGAMGALVPFDQAALDHAFDQNRG
jgi:hypothetical protein